jgi:hypothetical protein
MGELSSLIASFPSPSFTSFLPIPCQHILTNSAAHVPPIYISSHLITYYRLFFSSRDAIAGIGGKAVVLRGVCFFLFLRAYMITLFNHPFPITQTPKWTHSKTILSNPSGSTSSSIPSSTCRQAAATYTERLWRVRRWRLLEGWVGRCGCEYGCGCDGEAGKAKEGAVYLFVATVASRGSTM